MEIAKMLILSTGHVTGETAKLLDEGSDDLPISIYNKGDYGWLIPIDPLDPKEYHHLPKDLATVITFAINQECQWIMFDCDALEVKGLPMYEW